MTSLHIPASVGEIGSGAFRGCAALTQATVLNDGCAIGNGAHDVFADCASELTLCGWTPSTAKVYAGTADLPFTSLCIIYGQIGADVTYSFNPVNGVLDITGMGPMYDYSQESPSPFDSNVYVAGVAIADGITSIGDSAFEWCTDLALVELPEGVQTIGEAAFNKSGLTSVAIPSTVTDIGNGAFCNCKLVSITIPGNVKRIGQDAFYACHDLQEVILEDGIESIEYEAFRACNALRSVTIPGSVQTYGGSAFWEWTGLEEVILQDGVTKVGSIWFRSCTKLTSVTIPDSVVSINSSAFQGCAGLTQITIPESVEQIQSQAFQGCTGLSLVSLPEGLKRIGSEAFRDCTGLTRVEIPGSVENIESDPFRNCTSLQEVFLLHGDGDTFPKNLGSVLPSGCTVYCYEGTAAAEWAAGKGYPVTCLDAWNPDETRQITLSCGNFRLIEGDAATIGATVFPSYDDPKVVWTSSKPDIAAADGGMITGISSGKAVITASVGEISKSVEVEVYLPTVTKVSIAIDKTAPVRLTAGSTLQLTVFVTTEGRVYTNRFVRYSVNLTNVATVDENGLVTAHGLGRAQIIASASGGVYDSFFVQVVCDHQPETVEARPATCTEAGYLEGALRCRVCGANLTPNLVVPALGHLWSDVRYEWDFDSGIVAAPTLTASCACGRVESHAETETRSVSAALTPPTTESEGRIVYTSLPFANPAFQAQVLTDELPALNSPGAFMLPNDLMEINSDAFRGLSCRAVVIPDGCRILGEDAFADCTELRYVHLPVALREQAEAAFTGCQRVMLDFIDP